MIQVFTITEPGITRGERSRTMMPALGTLPYTPDGKSKIAENKTTSQNNLSVLLLF
jgi:hypothetical protein